METTIIFIAMYTFIKKSNTFEEVIYKNVSNDQ